MTPFRIGRKTFVIFFMHFEKYPSPASPLPDPGSGQAARFPHKLRDPQVPGAHRTGTHASRAARSIFSLLARPAPEPGRLEEHTNPGAAGFQGSSSKYQRPRGSRISVPSSPFSKRTRKPCSLFLSAGDLTRPMISTESAASP